MSKINEIAFTKSSAPFGWMGNMSRYKIFYNDKEWGSTEALFQALRFPENSPFREEIRLAKNGFEAKQVAKANRDKMSVTPTSEEDLDNMRLCIRLKIEQHSELKPILIGSKGINIYEDVTKRGDVGSNLIWGAIKQEDGTWVGENIMGVLWMELRDKLVGKTEVECERRFLLKRVPHTEYDKIIKIEQDYLTDINSVKVERVRLSTIISDDIDIFTHTIKEPLSSFSVNETEREISYHEHEELLRNSNRQIRKMRYVKNTDNNLKWEIDMMLDMDLTIAEIEVPNEDYELVLPKYIKDNLIMEITGMNEFSNSVLAVENEKIICDNCNYEITNKQIYEDLYMRVEGGKFIHWNCDD